MKVFYKESSSSDDTKKKATLKAEAKTVAGRKFPSPDAQRVCRSTTLNFLEVTRMKKMLEMTRVMWKKKLVNLVYMSMSLGSVLKGLLFYRMESVKLQTDSIAVQI